MVNHIRRKRKHTRKKLRDDVHREGDWHETFHCWLIERDNEDLSLYFQLRARDKKISQENGTSHLLDILCMTKIC